MSVSASASRVLSRSRGPGWILPECAPSVLRSACHTGALLLLSPPVRAVFVADARDQKNETTTTTNIPTTKNSTDVHDDEDAETAATVASSIRVQQKYTTQRYDSCASAACFSSQSSAAGQQGVRERHSAARKAYDTYFVDTLGRRRRARAARGETMSTASGGARANSSVIVVGGPPPTPPRDLRCAAEARCRLTSSTIQNSSPRKRNTPRRKNVVCVAASCT